MIELTELSGKLVLINCDLIKKIEATPDTLIRFLDGSFLLVKESFNEIQNKVLKHKSEIQRNQLCN